MLARLLLVCLCLAASVTTPGQAPMAVTTDTAAYCARLGRRLSAQAAAVQGATVPLLARLGDQGRARCAAGDVRDGIRRLREALLLAGAAAQPASGGRPRMAASGGRPRMAASGGRPRMAASGGAASWQVPASAPGASPRSDALP